MKNPRKFLPYLGVWLILSIGLIVFLVFSFSEKDVKLGRYEIKKPPFKETLMKDKKEKKAIATDSLTTESGVAVEAIEPGGKIMTEPDTTVKSVLLFGDSMTILIGNRVAYYGAQNNYETNSVTWYSSNTKVWSECDTLEYFLDKFKPDFIIVTLGSNELFVRDIEKRQEYTEKIIKKMGNIPFVWIGPPNWKPDKGINDMLSSTLPEKTFFLTNGMKLARGSDHVHPTQPAANLWTDSIMRWIPKSRHPILTEKPSAEIKKPKHNRILLSSPR